MSKREKVIKGLECCTTAIGCCECPYAEGEKATVSCKLQIDRDALALLKDYDAFCKWLVKDIMVNTDPDDDYYNPEVACRKLHMLGYVEYDAEKDAWRVNDGQA